VSGSEQQQLNLADYVQALEEERQTVERVNTERQKRRSFIVFATDPERVGEEDYKLVFACEARTQAEAERKVRRLAGEGRRPPHISPQGSTGSSFQKRVGSLNSGSRSRSLRGVAFVAVPRLGDEERLRLVGDPLEPCATRRNDDESFLASGDVLLGPIDPSVERRVDSCRRSCRNVSSGP